MALSIRWRLTLWNALASALVLLGFAALVYLLLARALYQQTDHKLAAALDRLEGDARIHSEGDARLRYWIEEFHEHDGLFAAVYAEERVARTEVLAAESLPPAPGSARRFRDAALPYVGRQRLLEARTRVGGREAGVVLMAPLADADRELQRLLAALLLAVPFALLGSVALGYLLARRALLPIQLLRRQTEQITSDRLDLRLPLANPHDELGRLAATVNDMIARLERSFAEVRRFTADASHELRTPLTALRVEAELALARPLGPAEQQQFLGSILEEVERLTRLTEQLLSLAREDAGVATQRKPVDLGDLAVSVVETLRPLAESQGVTLTCEASAGVRTSGDEGRLRQVLINVIDNAIKYTPAGIILVRVRAEKGEAVVTVADTGIGIPPEHLSRVFDRFYRVDKARSRAEGGSGLGLSIARSIVAAHDGEIEIQSALGRGTTARVVLPHKPAVAEE